VSGVSDVRLEQAARSDWAAAASAEWATAPALWAHLTGATNLVDAARAFDFAALLGDRATVLDLGCGSGWLAGLLSAHEKVARVIAWDGSPHLVEHVLPEMVGLAGGDMARVERVCGDFVPLLLDDAAVDLVAMSSAFHHADDPHALLAELRRVLRPGGAVVLLNETPWTRVMVLGFATRMYAAALAGLARGTPVRRPGHLGAGHVLYDDRLGDRGYTAGALRALAREHGFSVELRDSGLPSYKPSYRERMRLEPNLTHVILRA
jgi:SAM-dependent methyltransferase